MRHHGFDEPILFKRLTLNSKLHENENKNKLTLINLSYFFFIHIDYRYPDNLLRLSRALSIFLRICIDI